MVVENIGLGFHWHKIRHSYQEFYDRWSGHCSGCNECVWIVPETVLENEESKL
jgi:MinD superfamily P-loop ATPase